MTDERSGTQPEFAPTAIAPPAGCPIGWQPSALAPVFFGYRDFAAAENGAPTKVRVFYPSLDGAPLGAPILTGCGRYPLIVFAHGNCDFDTNHYQRWFHLPAQLARSGYVVAVPDLPGIQGHPAVTPGPQTALAGTLTWMRQRWPDRLTLLPAVAATGLAGHSYGALHAGILGTRTMVAAVASISGVWGDWQPSYGTKPIYDDPVPRLLTWGTEEGDARLTDPDWNAIAKPKHRAVFAQAEHYDYFPYSQPPPCRFGGGPCSKVGVATTDLVIMFFANYLAPELWPDLPSRIPSNLVPPPLSLTPQQQFYASGHLVGLSSFNNTAGCSVSITFQLPLDKTVPHVREMLQPQAANAIRAAGLVPKFSGSTSPSAWVASQAPSGGTMVAAETEVRMTMQTGPVP